MSRLSSMSPLDSIAISSSSLPFPPGRPFKRSNIVPFGKITAKNADSR